MRIGSTLAAASLTVGLGLAATAPAGAAAPADLGPRPAPAGASVRDASALRTFTTWATNVNVRNNNANPTVCTDAPSVTNCPHVAGQMNPGVWFSAWCQTTGQTVGGNPYWVYISAPMPNSPNFSGWIASYYIDYPDNVLPDTQFC